MADLSQPITGSSLWQSTLAFDTDDPFSTPRERLRSSFIRLRDHCGFLAGEIRKDLPDLTVHDLSHLDALWEIASIIVGNDYPITPTEGYVLGGAFLLHDLAMSVVGIEGGYQAIKIDPRWADLVTFEYQEIHGRKPTPDEISQPETRVEKKALFNILRQIHAENAENLAFLSFPSSNNSSLFLIEDPEMRQTFGRIIGQIAHSHWWSLSDVEHNFSRVIGPPHWCPPEWTIDPLKLACILRTADASHLDARRAPIFLKAISKLSEDSEEHWHFQEQLNKPYLNEDALVFTTGHAFRFDEASSWWLCLDTLRVTDRELRSVDSLLAEKGGPRFAARRVAGVDDPERLASFIQTDRWLPINALVHVSDLPAIINSLGGEELYGKHPEVALRELIQNSCDAIRARRLYEKRDAKFGMIVVSISNLPDGYWLQIRDNGIGMSKRVLTDVLLDFGKSFWGSPQMQEEFPGLLSSGIKATGKYGVGFFSVFMVAEKVQILTRRSDTAVNDTLVVEFNLGTRGRPLLRPAEKSEQLIDGGTQVKLKLKNNPYKEQGMLFKQYPPETMSLDKLCQEICPSIDADLYIEELDSEQKVISANDWQYMDGAELLNRMGLVAHSSRPVDEYELQKIRQMYAPNLRTIANESGEIIGRAAITSGFGKYGHFNNPEGVITVGGLRACGLSGICGVLIGESLRASRDIARPIISETMLKAWAEDQADLVSQIYDNFEDQAACAYHIWLCGGDTKRLPICIYQEKWVSADEIANMTNPPTEVVIIDHMSVDKELHQLESYILDPNVFITESSGVPGMMRDHSFNRHADWPPTRLGHSPFGWAVNTLAGALITALARAWACPLEAVFMANDIDYTARLKVGTIGNRDFFARGIYLKAP